MLNVLCGSMFFMGIGILLCCLCTLDLRDHYNAFIEVLSVTITTSLFSICHFLR